MNLPSPFAVVMAAVHMQASEGLAFIERQLDALAQSSRCFEQGALEVDFRMRSLGVTTVSEHELQPYLRGLDAMSTSLAPVPVTVPLKRRRLRGKQAPPAWYRGGAAP